MRDSKKKKKKERKRDTISSGPLHGELSHKVHKNGKRVVQERRHHCFRGMENINLERQ